MLYLLLEPASQDLLTEPEDLTEDAPAYLTEPEDNNNYYSRREPKLQVPRASTEDKGLQEEELLVPKQGRSTKISNNLQLKEEEL